jgi:type III pantothenate kinase
MLLAVDIGNTNVTLGLFHEDKCMQFWRLNSDARRTEDEYGILIQQLFATSGITPEQIAAVVLGSVVPTLSDVLGNALRRASGCQPFHVTHHVKLPVKNCYAKPGEVGVDRIANAAGAIRLVGAPVIAVDLGTAVTLDVVSKDAEYLGGAILPGIELSAEALARRTARLPLTSAHIPTQAIGRTTVQSIRSGIFLGLAGSIDHLIELMWKELGYKTATIATGGLAPAITDRCRRVKRSNSELTLLGLIDIYQLNNQAPATAKRNKGRRRNG